MSAIKHALTTLTAAAFLGAAPAFAHPAGHEEFSVGELMEHLTSDPFHLISILAAVVAIALMLRRLRASRKAGKSEAANE